MKRTAMIITTGDEITDGEILNTTGPAIAQRLVEYGYKISRHILLPDDEKAISDVILGGLKDNEIIITTGGLGPTSDDLTRFALAKALNSELIFDEKSWQQICHRLESIRLDIHEDNKRQAYFPQSAEIFPNPNGTANGCGIKQAGKFIFMLPGPPHECLPMFNDYALPMLSKHSIHKLHWLLLGASEGEVAALLDQALAPFNCHTGYRAEYPYLEFKAWADNESQLQQIADTAEPLINQYLVSKQNIKASILLTQHITQQTNNIKINDQATLGLLQATISLPDTINKIDFVDDNDADIIISGLSDYWQGKTAPAETRILFQYKDKTIEKSCYYRGDRIKTYAVEWICWQWLQQLGENYAN